MGTREMVMVGTRTVLSALNRSSIPDARETPLYFVASGARGGGSSNAYYLSSPSPSPS